MTVRPVATPMIRPIATAGSSNGRNASGKSQRIPERIVYSPFRLNLEVALPSRLFGHFGGHTTTAVKLSPSLVKDAETLADLTLGFSASRRMLDAFPILGDEGGLLV